MKGRGGGSISPSLLFWTKGGKNTIFGATPKLYRLERSWRSPESVRQGPSPLRVRELTGELVLSVVFCVFRVVFCVFDVVFCVFAVVFRVFAVVFCVFAVVFRVF